MHTDGRRDYARSLTFNEATTTSFDDDAATIGGTCNFLPRRCPTIASRDLVDSLPDQPNLARVTRHT